MKKIALGIIIGLLFTILINASSVLGDFESALAQKLLGRSGRVGDVETPINGNIWNEQRTVMIGTDRFAAVYYQFVPFGNVDLQDIYDAMPDYSCVLYDASLSGTLTLDQRLALCGLTAGQ